MTSVVSIRETTTGRTVSKVISLDRTRQWFTQPGLRIILCGSEKPRSTSFTNPLVRVLLKTNSVSVLINTTVSAPSLPECMALFPLWVLPPPPLAGLLAPLRLSLSLVTV